MERKPKTDEELKQIAIDILAGRIFSDRHIQAGEPEEWASTVKMVFMPIALMRPDELRKIVEEDGATFIYEQMEAAGPRSVNGLPIFMSFQFLTKPETEKMLDYYDALKKAQDGVKI